MQKLTTGPSRPRKHRFIPSYLWKSQGRWFWLFHMLILLLVLYPYLEAHTEGQRPLFLILMNTAVIISMVHAVSSHRRQFFLAIALAAPALAARFVAPGEWMYFIGLGCYVLLYFYTILRILDKLLYSEETSTEEIFGATSVYIILGLAWATIFEVINFIYPGSFVVSAIHNVDQVLNWSDYIYFSFTTLTTLGYGDMIPVSSQARSIAILESITGVIFLAVMVARVIGLYITQTLLRNQKKI